MLGMLAKFLKILNSEAAPGQIALGFAMALFWGLTPFFSLHNLFVLLFVCIFRVNIAAFFLASAVFALLAFALDPVSISIGEALLTKPELQSFWTSLYQSDVLRAFKFNHTLLLGSVCMAVLLFVPVFLLSKKFVLVYRSKMMATLEKFRITKLIKASKFYKIYEKLGA